jgi:hypothetical protein
VNRPPAPQFFVQWTARSTLQAELLLHDTSAQARAARQARERAKRRQANPMLRHVPDFDSGPPPDGW